MSTLPTFARTGVARARYSQSVRSTVRLAVLALVGMLLPAAARADDRDPVHLRVGTLAMQGTRYGTDMEALGAAIDRAPRGAVVLDWVSDGRLGEEADMARLIAAGKLDGGGLSETGLVALVPAMAAWGEPGRFHTYADVDAAIASADAGLRERFAKADLELVMWADLGFARVFSRDPLRDLSATLRDPALRRPFDGALGAAIAKGELRTWAVPPLYMLALGNHARYMTNLRYRYVIGALVLSRSAWARLTQRQQAAVREVCRTWEAKIRAGWRKETERGIAALDKAGVATRVATDADVAAFVEITAAQRAAR